MLWGMYAEFFGLKQDPFSIAPDPRYLFMSERHREALAHLLYGIRGGGGFVLLSGEIGAGKTTICRCFLEQIPERCRVAYIFNPKLTVADLLKTICHEFNIEVKHEGIGPATIKDYLDPLNEHLLRSHANGERNVLIIDEAQNLTPHVLEQLRLLTNLETSERKLLQIILIGQPELRTVLARPELEQLAQRVIARFHLGALNEAETRQYIQHRMQVAGLRGPLPFSSQAIQRIHEIARGVPRRINLLCDRALLGAYATGQPRVDRSVVDKAAGEVFETEAPAPDVRRRAARARSRTSALPLLGAGLVAGLVLAGAAFWWWSLQQNRPAAVADGTTPTTAGTAPVAPAPGSPSAATAPADPPMSAAPAAAALPSGPPPLSELHTTEAVALRELGPLWGQALDEGEPCAAAQRAELQCYRTDRLTLSGMRQLDRPGIVTLRLSEGSGLALVTCRRGASAGACRSRHWPTSGAATSPRSGAHRRGSKADWWTAGTVPRANGWRVASPDCRPRARCRPQPTTSRPASRRSSASTASIPRGSRGPSRSCR
jgi:general secretion pathway protein A